MKKELTRVEKLKQELKIAMSIEKRNKAFNKLSKPEKRVAIAKDVIIALKAKKYIAKSGDYLNLNSKSGKDLFGVNINQELLCSDDVTCTVCAIGAMFTSKVAISNNFDDYRPSDNEMRSHLSKYFSMPQLHLIESAFEGWEKGSTSISGNIPNDNHMIFEEKYPNDNDRMIAIMENIVENKGTFKP